MSESLQSHCRLCNYASDSRLMMKIFDENSGYQEKIENYLSLKVRVLKIIKFKIYSNINSF
jgi:hypothetical protein